MRIFLFCWILNVVVVVLWFPSVELVGISRSHDMTKSNQKFHRLDVARSIFYCYFAPPQSWIKHCRILRIIIEEKTVVVFILKWIKTVHISFIKKQYLWYYLEKQYLWYVSEINLTSSIRTSNTGWIGDLTSIEMLKLPLRQ